MKQSHTQELLQRETEIYQKRQKEHDSLLAELSETNRNFKALTKENGELMDRYSRLARDAKYADEHIGKYKSTAEILERKVGEFEKMVEKKNQTIDGLTKELKKVYGEMDVRDEENYVRMKELQLNINQLMDRRTSKRAVL